MSWTKVTVPKELYDELKKKAKKEGIPMHELIRKLLVPEEKAREATAKDLLIPIIHVVHDLITSLLYSGVYSEEDLRELGDTLVGLYEDLAKIDKKYANKLIDERIIDTPISYFEEIGLEDLEPWEGRVRLDWYKALREYYPEKLSEWLSPDEIKELDKELKSLKNVSKESQKA